MSLLTNTIKRAEKLANKKVTVLHNGQKYFVAYKGYFVSFCCNGRLEPNSDSTCFYTIKEGNQDDYNSDYFAGTFHDNIKQCFDFIDRMTTRNLQIA